MDEKNREILKNIDNTTSRAVETLKALNHIIDNKKDFDLPNEQIPIQEEILSVAKNLNKLDAKVISFQKDLDQLKIPFAKVHFNNVIADILSNNYKFQDLNKKLAIDISYNIENEYIVLSIKDNGIGFDSVKYSEGLFKLFMRFNLNKEGQGIGLYNIKSTMENYGGNVTIQSSPNQGTVINLLFKKDF